MFGLFEKKYSIEGAGLLKGAVDNHSHILYGMDDGVKTQEDSLAILEYLEGEGMREVWCTPHVMEDVPNTTEAIKARFEELKSVYTGNLTLHLAAEYMIDNLFEARLSEMDLMTHGSDFVLVETSAVAPPINLWEVLERMCSSGFRPLIAHPERYRYMEKRDYQRLSTMGCIMQLNMPSIVGFYGGDVQARAQMLLDYGMYAMVGSDCHRFNAIRKQYSVKLLKKKTIDQLSFLMEGVDIL